MRVDRRNDRVELWATMAEHFLDTETRHDIPLTALFCLCEGLSLAEARYIWRHEVTPAVGFNLWSVAGEWEGWDRDWLVARVRQARVRRAYWPQPLRWFLYRIQVHAVHGVWVAIERCIETLAQIQLVEQRDRLAEDLSVLARHYFDVEAGGEACVEKGRRARLRAAFPRFCYIMAPATIPAEVQSSEARVRAALCD